MPDSSVYRLCIPFHCGYKDSASIALHFEVVKSDETVKATSGRAQEIMMARAAKMAGAARTLVAALLARLEPSLRFRFSLIALGRGEKISALKGQHDNSPG